MPLLALGFRPFFLIAGIFAVLAIALWAVVYPAHVVLPLQGISSFQWHAHEMIYGYSVAVISGFLLTAVYNWTGIQTPRDWALATLVALWLVGRVALACGLLLVAGVFDALFLASLCVAVGRPLIQAKQWKQMAILGKLIFLLVLNCLFYLGALGVVEQGIYWGIYGGLYVVVGTLAGRHLPVADEASMPAPVLRCDSLHSCLDEPLRKAALWHQLEPLRRATESSDPS